MTVDFSDLTKRQLPRLVFVIPNLDHDMHGAGEGGDDPALIAAADHWLAGLYRKLAGSPAWHNATRLVITWDEAASGERAGCCGGLAAGGQVATIITGPQVKAGRDDTPTATTP